VSFPYEFPIELTLKGRQEIDLDAYISATDSTSISLDMWIGLPPGPHWRYMLEVRERDGTLLAILQDAFNINYALSEGVPELSFELPADNDKTVYLARNREIWLRNMKTNTVMARFNPSLQRERR